MQISDIKTYENIKLSDKGKYIVKSRMFLYCNGGIYITFSSRIKIKRQQYLKNSFNNC